MDVQLLLWIISAIFAAVVAFTDKEFTTKVKSPASAAYLLFALLLYFLKDIVTANPVGAVIYLVVVEFLAKVWGMLLTVAWVKDLLVLSSR
ncbi:hypothetical protein DRH29_05105 [candidate division Kazan bacterium]|uniref:Uncharacterized protein n=1 Tax=candidate division Kazan bacterium TaxID=2202143 RepID=A0A420ZBC0_UNCK3|nr:MAG: hypothetical protein DRH29_05105 [candidate division Kazan bacterium]